MLTDADDNSYAVPCRVVERARVPDELRDIFPSLRGPLWSRGVQQLRRLSASGVTPVQVPAAGITLPRGPRVQPRLPWTVGWFQIPPR
ncbi:MAG TPA: hypothetical protein VK821_14160 [Dehalococcoidia bacterium]|nr:hypothetical protein [Dehalococcoidia bacterium]